MKNAQQFPELLQTFFTERLMHQRRASAHTVASYRDTFRLLFSFAQQRIHKEPSALIIEDLNAEFIGAFLSDLEKTRGIGPRTRNVRLAAIHSFFRYVAINEPVHTAFSQRVLAIPTKRFDRKPIEFLTSTEIDAVLGAPDQKTWGGRRDYTFLLTAVQTGLRVSELIGLRCEDIVLGAGAHVRCMVSFRQACVARVKISGCGKAGHNSLYLTLAGQLGKDAGALTLASVWT
jgi:integrase/recombinase XerD